MDTAQFNLLTASAARMIQIMQQMAEDSEVARTRVQVLSQFLI
jgi:hypothetical protein